jgi:hypothetical protein
MPSDESSDLGGESASQAAVQLPLEALAAETLRRVAEEIVSRDGTDYGAVEKTLEEKVENLLRELRAGRAALWFDPETQTTSVEPVPPGSRRG